MFFQFILCKAEISLLHLKSIPFENVRIKWEKTVKRVSASRYRITPTAASDDWQKLPVVPFNNGVAEHQLVFP